MFKTSRFYITLFLLLGAHEHWVYPQQEAAQITSKKEIVFINNLADIIIMVEMDESRLIALDNVIRNTKVCVNKTIIPHGELITLPVTDDTCTISISMDATAAAPFLNFAGIYKFLAKFVEFQLDFNQTLDPETHDVYILFPILAKCEEWETQTPAITIGYKPPFKAKVCISDMQN